MYLKNLFLTSVLLIMLYFNHLFLFFLKQASKIHVIVAGG